MRRRILLLIMAITLLVVLAFAIPVGFLIHDAVIQRAERSASDQARSVALFLRTGSPSSTDIKNYVAGLSQTQDHSTSVRLSDGTTFGTVRSLSGNSPNGSLGPGNGNGGYGGPNGGQGADLDGVQPPQIVHVPGGETAVTTVSFDGGPANVSVFVSSSALDSGVYGWWLLLAGSSAALLIIGLVGGEIVTRRIVRPLSETADTANRITAGDVTARAPASGPREVAEVGVALNRLADRIDQLIAEERETVADLSHRLRTPLTALRLDAESLSDPVEAERVGAHVSALERMLTAVIRAARRPQREGRMPSTDATAVVADRVEFWSALTDEQGRPSSLTLPPAPVLVRASAEDLGAAVDALLENVIAHTPDGTAFAVALEPLPEGGGRIEISDDGPGLPDDEIVRGRSDRGSSGLGLDIARRSAEAGGGTMRIGRSPAGGASIVLVFRSP
jgi:signal transduction histidine kinase